MIYTLKGTCERGGEGFIVLECGGVGYKILANKRTLASLAGSPRETTFFVSQFIRDDRIELFGFLEDGELKLFELLNTVAGVGPKTALGILDVDTVPNIIAAIIEKRADLLARAPGIGKKTAERVIVELQNRVKLSGTEALAKTMDANLELEEILVGLGYTRADVKRAVESLPKEGTVEQRLKQALKELGTRN